MWAMRTLMWSKEKFGDLTITHPTLMQFASCSIQVWSALKTSKWKELMVSSSIVMWARLRGATQVVRGTVYWQESSQIITNIMDTLWSLRTLNLLRTSQRMTSHYCRKLRTKWVRTGTIRRTFQSITARSVTFSQITWPLTWTTSHLSSSV